MIRNTIVVTVALALILPPQVFPEAEIQSLKNSKHVESIPFEVVKRVRLPRGYHEGLFLDSGRIWVANGKKGKIWVIDPSSGKVLNNIEPISGFTEGITSMPNGNLFVTDWDEQKLYLAKKEGDRLLPKSEVDLKPSLPAGVVWNDSNLYVIAWTRGFGTKFDLLEMDSNGALIRRIPIKSIMEPAHLAWDGNNLWITSWYSKIVYKIDIAKWEVVGKFISPVSAPTGIAWDGRYLWLTGTHGDLYQLKVGG